MAGVRNTVSLQDLVVMSDLFRLSPRRFSIVLPLVFTLFAASAHFASVRALAQEEAAEESNDDASKKKKTEKISLRPYLSVDKLPPGNQCEILLYVTVQEGWHINANPAMPENFIPTKVTLKSKQKCELVELKYPKARELSLQGFKEPVHTYDGRVAIRGVVTVPITAAGQVDEFELHVRYQACNDQNCLPPTTLVFKTKVPVAGLGQEVKPLNQNLFRAEEEKAKQEAAGE